MLLGKPQQWLDPEPRTRTDAALPQLALHGGQLTLQRLDLFPVSAGPVRQLLDVLVHLMAVIAAERHLENPRGWLPWDVTGLGISPGIHALTLQSPGQAGETSPNARYARHPGDFAPQDLSHAAILQGTGPPPEAQ
jgi:hypothetical protein